MQLRRNAVCIRRILVKRLGGLTAMAATFHSAPILGINLCALLWPSLTPVRILIVRGISPSALFIPIRIFPNFPAAHSTVSEEDLSTFCFKTDTAKSVRAEPLPVLKTRSIGQPQFKSTKSMPLPLHSLAMTSAVGTSVVGLLPATCTPNIVSDGCRLTKDHSSLEPDKRAVARPTMCPMNFLKEKHILALQSTHFLHT